MPEEARHPTVVSERSRQIEAFLAAVGWRHAEVRPLAGDASFRRYHRVRHNSAGAVLMDAPPEREDVQPFLRIARHLHQLGLSAPAIFAADEANGLLLLEDFGDNTFSRLLASGTDAEALYTSALDVLIHLHRLSASTAIPAQLPAYDEQRLLDEALLLVDWYMPAVMNTPPDAGVREAYIAAWRKTLAPVLAQATPPTLVLRDFHVDNLMRLDGRDGLAACGLLDFQDAVAGPAAYDLMSLLEDARRDVDPVLKAEMLARYRAAMPKGDDLARWRAFEWSFAALAAQRHAKVIGIFTRLYRRDDKPAYLVHIPRVWRLLEGALEHEALAPLARWFDQHLPPSSRRAPPCPTAAT